MPNSWICLPRVAHSEHDRRRERERGRERRKEILSSRILSQQTQSGSQRICKNMRDISSRVAGNKISHSFFGGKALRSFLVVEGGRYVMDRQTTPRLFRTTIQTIQTIQADYPNYPDYPDYPYYPNTYNSQARSKSMNTPSAYYDILSPCPTHQ